MIAWKKEEDIYTNLASWLHMPPCVKNHQNVLLCFCDLEPWVSAVSPVPGREGFGHIESIKIPVILIQLVTGWRLLVLMLSFIWGKFFYRLIPLKWAVILLKSRWTSTRYFSNSTGPSATTCRFSLDTGMWVFFIYFSSLDTYMCG